MDTNYILEREQVSLHNASVATSSSARIAHEGLAAAYGALLADSAFRHRYQVGSVRPIREEEEVDHWENEGGATAQREAKRSGDPAALPHGNTGAIAEATRGRVVQTPGEVQPYKVVLQHESGGDTEQPVASVREGEQLIRDQTPKPGRRSTLLDRPALGR